MASTRDEIIKRLRQQPARERDIRRGLSRRLDYGEVMRVLMKNGYVITSGKGTKSDPKMVRLPDATDELCKHCLGTGREPK